MSNVKEALLAFVFALIFGIGLAVSGMLDPANVIGFLRLGEFWRPELALVMASAIVAAFPFFWLGKKRIEKNFTPIMGEKFDAPPTIPDPKLIYGAAIFGIGWGLIGICPGPAIVLLGIAPSIILPFLLAAAIGAAFSDLVVKKVLA